jgi:hypothetical protein
VFFTVSHILFILVGSTSGMEKEIEFCEGEFEGSVATMSDREYAEYRKSQREADDARNEERNALNLSDAKQGMI